MCAKPSLKIKYVYTLVQAGLKRVLKNRLILVFRRLLDQVNLILMTLATNIPSNRNDNTRNEESLAGSSQSDQDESLSSSGTGSTIVSTKNIDKQFTEETKTTIADASPSQSSRWIHNKKS
jgi:hypothetical protein